MSDEKQLRHDEFNKLSVTDQQKICSHDAPGQKKGEKCKRCGATVPADTAPEPKDEGKAEGFADPLPLKK